jgi:hypothetical protein
MPCTTTTRRPRMKNRGGACLICPHDAVQISLRRAASTRAGDDTGGCAALPTGHHGSKVVGIALPEPVQKLLYRGPSSGIHVKLYRKLHAKGTSNLMLSDVNPSLGFKPHSRGSRARAPSYTASNNPGPSPRCTAMAASTPNPAYLVLIHSWHLCALAGRFFSGSGDVREKKPTAFL